MQREFSGWLSAREILTSNDGRVETLGDLSTSGGDVYTDDKEIMNFVSGSFYHVFVQSRDTRKKAARQVFGARQIDTKSVV